jgi:putative redox protein
MKSTVTWTTEGLVFEGVSASGHRLSIDGDSKRAPSPMECLQMSVGACSSVDVVMILQKMREDISGCRCELSGMRRETSPRLFTAIHAHYVVSGRGLSRVKVARAVALSMEKYCSVSLMLQETVEMTSSFEVVDA